MNAMNFIPAKFKEQQSKMGRDTRAVYLECARIEAGTRTFSRIVNRIKQAYQMATR